MIDEVGASEKVEAMHKAASENLARALAVERYLFTVLENREFSTAYNPEVSTLLIRYKLKGGNAVKNIIGLVKSGVKANPLRVLNGEATYLVFSGGFSVVLKAEM